jgi:hypothetical protein
MSLPLQAPVSCWLENNPFLLQSFTPRTWWQTRLTNISALQQVLFVTQLWGSIYIWLLMKQLWCWQPLEMRQSDCNVGHRFAGTDFHICSLLLFWLSFYTFLFSRSFLSDLLDCLGNYPLSVASTDPDNLFTFRFCVMLIFLNSVFVQAGSSCWMLGSAVGL